MYLDAAELEELTGYRQKGKQVQWLTDNRVRFLVNRAGFPMVLTAERDRIMIGGPASGRKQVATPNFDLVNA